MWDVEELFVFSDLHLTAERDTGLFRSDAGLVDCLHWILKENRGSVVVLAGDVFDFLTSHNGTPLTDITAICEFTRMITACHPEVFDALAELARSRRHRLVIMGGNHDSELIFPAVQETIERGLGANFLDRSVYWMVHGEAFCLRVGGAVVLVEHGNILDPWNKINHAALQRALSLASHNFSFSALDDYQPPPGSRLVLEVVNDLRPTYQWIDALKPETEAVLPLLWHFATWKQRRMILNLADEYMSMKAFAWNKKIGNLRPSERLYKGEKELENAPRDQAFKEWFDAAYEQQRLTLGVEGGYHRMIKKLRSVSAHDTFFDIDQSDDSTNYLQPVFESGVDLIIHGHTHSAKACVLEGGMYLNTGTWGQLLRLPQSYESDTVWQDFLNLLRTNNVECFSRPTFARIRRESGRELTTAALLEWQQAGPKSLAARSFTDRQTGWQLKG
jgi:UDP-2,3-diacylglucosamine pyrophosphatase LpxH